MSVQMNFTLAFITQVKLLLVQHICLKLKLEYDIVATSFYCFSVLGNCMLIFFLLSN